MASTSRNRARAPGPALAADAAHCGVVASLTVPARPEYLRAVRELVGTAAGGGDTAAGAVLLADELAANSIKHGPAGPEARITITVAGNPGAVWVEVADGGGSSVPAPRPGDEYGENGRGLHLVDALSARWGYRRASGGALITWFEIRAAQGPQSRAGSEQEGQR
jgi:anti-sigma regulatory factor (Ser/Thr protein kinase)